MKILYLKLRIKRACALSLAQIEVVTIGHVKEKVRKFVLVSHLFSSIMLNIQHSQIRSHEIIPVSLLIG